jgi:hypothetical protein
MADAQECWRQAAECARLSQTDVTRKTETIMLGMARSWISLAKQMDRLDDHDPVNAAYLALARDSLYENVNRADPRALP